MHYYTGFELFKWSIFQLKLRNYEKNNQFKIKVDCYDRIQYNVAVILYYVLVDVYKEQALQREQNTQLSFQMEQY